VSENGVLKRLFGPKREEMTGGWKKLHNGKLHNLHFSLNVSRIMTLRRIRLAGNVAYMGEKGSACIVLIGKPEGKRPLRRPRRTWDDNAEKDLSDARWWLWNGFISLRIKTNVGLL
jgi:hypothetical protein